MLQLSSTVTPSRTTLVHRTSAAACALIALIVFLGAQSGCSHNSTGGGPLTVPLSYTPEHASELIRLYPASVPATRIFVGPIQDQRDRKDAIGVNNEHANSVLIRSANDPADFVRQTLVTQLKRAGLHVVSDASQADRTLTGNLTHFWVIETNNYEAQIDVNFRVLDSSGAVKWEGAETGKGSNFGSSLSAENYRETLSDAMVRLVYGNLLTNPNFQAALK